MLLGERLRETRQKKGVSQSTVAEHLNISRQSISKWENNSSYPDLDNLVRLSEYYEVTVDDLLKENQGLKKKIEENNEKIKDSQKKLAYIQANGERDEGLVLLMLNLLSCLIAPLGLFITPIILKRNKATNTFYKLVFVAGVISLLVNLFGLYAHLGNLFHWGGPSSVEYVGNQ